MSDAWCRQPRYGDIVAEDVNKGSLQRTRLKSIKESTIVSVLLAVHSHSMPGRGGRLSAIPTCPLSNYILRIFLSSPALLTSSIPYAPPFHHRHLPCAVYHMLQTASSQKGDAALLCLLPFEDSSLAKSVISTHSHTVKRKFGFHSPEGLAGCKSNANM